MEAGFQPEKKNFLAISLFIGHTPANFTMRIRILSDRSADLLVVR
jgi:hypothetical protein